MPETREVVYERPLFDVDPDHPVEGDPEQFRFKYVSHEHSRDGIVVVAEGSDERWGRWRFAVVDKTDKVCAYRGDDHADLPTAVLWVVGKENYSVRGVRAIDQEVIFYRELQILAQTVEQARVRFTDTEVMMGGLNRVYQWCMETAILMYLMGKVGDEVVDKMDAAVKAEQNEEGEIPFAKGVHRAMEVNTELFTESEAVVDDAMDEPVAPWPEDKSTEDIDTPELYTQSDRVSMSNSRDRFLVTVFSEQGIGKYVFVKNGGDECVHEPIGDNSYPPYEAIRCVEDTYDVTVSNVDTLFDETETIDAEFELAQGVTKHIIQWCTDRSGAARLMPVSLWNSLIRARVVTTLLRLSGDKESFNRLCYHSGIESFEELIAGGLLDNVGAFVSGLPDDHDKEELVDVVTKAVNMEKGGTSVDGVPIVADRRLKEVS